MTAADIRTRLRELAVLKYDWSGDGRKRPNQTALFHVALFLWCDEEYGRPKPDRVVPGSDGEVLVDWHTPIYRHREFDGTNPDGEYFEANI